MISILKDTALSLAVPILLALVGYYLEKIKSRNKYEEMYTKVFAPIEKIKLENPSIKKTAYLQRLDTLFQKDELYSLTPPRFYDQYTAYKRGEVTEDDFFSIIDNNTNELRRLIGMPHSCRTPYRKSQIYIKQQNDITIWLTIILLLFLSVLFPIAFLYPDTYDSIQRTMNSAENFLTVFVYGFILLTGLFLIGLIIKNAFQNVISSWNTRFFFQALKWLVIKLAASIVACILLFWIVAGLTDRYLSARTIPPPQTPALASNSLTIHEPSNDLDW